MRALSPFLVAGSSGLIEEALSGEASEAAAGDVHARLVGGHAEEFVQVTDPECLVGVLAFDGGQVRKARFVLGEGGGQVLDLTAKFTGPGRGLVVAGPEIGQELGDVHAAGRRSRQVGVGVVRRRAMFAAEAQ